MCKSLLNINAHADLSSRARGLNVAPGLQLHPYVVYASREGSSMFAHLCRLAHAVA